jgi:beta-N-acetylhexosaminidase
VLALAAGPAAATGPAPDAKLVGQTIMTGFAGTSPDAALLARIRAGQVGGLILFGANITSPDAARALIAQLQRAAAAGGNPPLLIAVDQEGGLVRRFPDGPPDLAPAQMATAAVSRSEGLATARYLRPLGVNVDLAPVVDSISSPAS